MIYLLKIKKNFIPILLLFFILSLLLFSTSTLNAAKSGLVMWATSVVPSLFPFLVATELLLNTQIPYLLGTLFKNVMKPLFNIQGEGAFAFILGVICGYPIGAKIICEFRKKNTLSKLECERLLGFINNSNPMFILGIIGSCFYGSQIIGILLLISHILSSITTGIFFRFWKYTNKISNRTVSNIKDSYNTINKSNFITLLSNSIVSSVNSIFMIGGFIVLFSVFISILNSSNILNILVLMLSPFFRLIHIPTIFISPLITGMLEITNGIHIISSISIKALSINIILTSFILGTGGISVFLQILSIVSKTDLSIKPYIYGKLLQSILSAFYTFLLIKIFPIFNFNL